MKRCVSSLSILLILSILLSVCLVGCDIPGSLGGNTPETSSESDGATSAIAHTDENDDGQCDDCGISVIVVLDLFSINDLHGKVLDASSHPGVDEMTTYLKSAYQTEDHVLILSSGDMWQGSAESNLTRGGIVTEWLNELGVVSMTLGNHEYDWGEAMIEQNAALAEFPFPFCPCLSSPSRTSASIAAVWNMWSSMPAGPPYR